MNARPRLHLLLMSIVLGVAISFLKVCCFGISNPSPSCCSLAQQGTQQGTQHDSPPANHSSPCCAGSSYLAKEDTSILVHPTDALSDPVASSLEKIAPPRIAPLPPVEKVGRSPSPQPLSRELALILQTCSAPNAPPRFIA